MAQRIAARVLELLAEGLADLLAAAATTAPEPAPATRLVDAATVARELAVSRSFVYEHAAELGAARIGAGQRPRLRFDLERARAAWNARQSNERSPTARSPVATGSPRRRLRTRSGTEPYLLPIRGIEGRP
jgi:hypothetical protein